MARAGLEELKLDYEDYLRQRGLPQWQKDNPLRQELINRRCQTADEVAAWIIVACKQQRDREKSEHASTPSTQSPNRYPELSANAVLVLLAVTCALLDRQVERLAQDFENQGDFTERLYRVRKAKRDRQRP